MRFKPRFSQTKKSLSAIAALAFLSAGCALGTYTEGTLQAISAQPLSLTDPQLKTCVFDPHYSIVHFPMYHAPADGHYTQEIYEQTAKSQFQLLHSLIAYNRAGWDLTLFDENVTSDTYNPAYFQSLITGHAANKTYSRMDGRVFQMGERVRTARSLFSGGFPRFYEHLSSPQKSFLFDSGASFTLYFLGEIKEIRKVISPEQWKLAKANLQGADGRIYLEGNEYWLFDFRENALRNELLWIYQRNQSRRGLFFIAYGASHDFSDDFAGLPFQSGHNFCLQWDSWQNPLP